MTQSLRDNRSEAVINMLLHWHGYGCSVIERRKRIFQYEKNKATSLVAIASDAIPNSKWPFASEPQVHEPANASAAWSAAFLLYAHKISGIEPSLAVRYSLPISACCSTTDKRDGWFWSLRPLNAEMKVG